MSGRRVRKDDDRVEAMGAVDELNSALGVAASALDSGEVRRIIVELQNDLFTIGAELAAPPDERPAKGFRPLGADRVRWVEDAIDRTAKLVGPQREFVLPGGHPAAAAIHLARSIARRAERRVVRLGVPSQARKEVLIYLNRLSSLLHVLALEVNRLNKVDETHPRYL